jgi:hypothetical protein
VELEGWVVRVIVPESGGSAQSVWGVQKSVFFTIRTGVGKVVVPIVGARLTVAGAGTSATDRAESVAFLRQRKG